MANDEEAALDAQYAVFLSELGVRAADWRAFGEKYGRTFKNGFAAYKETLKQASADEQAILDAFFAFATIVATQSGAALLASVGASSLKAFAKDQLMRTVAVSNLHRTFRALQYMDHYGASRFAIGTLAEGVESQGKKVITQQIQDALTALNKWGETRFDNGFEPEDAGSVLREFVDNSYARTGDLAEKLRYDKSLSFEDKKKALAALRETPIFQRPIGVYDEKALTEKMHLTFLLSHVLHSNYLRTYKGMPSSFQMTQQQGFTTMPGTPNYPPRSQYTPPSGPYRRPLSDQDSGAITRREFDVPAPAIQKKINELWAKYIDNKTPLFPISYPFQGPTEAQLTDLMYRARAGIDKLANQSRPTKFFPVKF